MKDGKFAGGIKGVGVSADYGMDEGFGRADVLGVFSSVTEDRGGTFGAEVIREAGEANHPCLVLGAEGEDKAEADYDCDSVSDVDKELVHGLQIPTLLLEGPVWRSYAMTIHVGFAGRGSSLSF